MELSSGGPNTRKQRRALPALQISTFPPVGCVGNRHFSGTQLRPAHLLHTKPFSRHSVAVARELITRRCFHKNSLPMPQLFEIYLSFYFHANACVRRAFGLRKTAYGCQCEFFRDGRAFSIATYLSSTYDRSSSAQFRTLLL